MADECLEFRKIESRCSELREWIQHKAPQCLTDQKHLEEGSQERGYWAHGYLSALQDIVRLFSQESIADERYGTGEKYAA
jgi:hypothetical protein